MTVLSRGFEHWVSYHPSLHATRNVAYLHCTYSSSWHGLNDLEQFANAKVVESLNALFAGVEPGTGVPLKCPPCAVTELRGDWKFFKEFGSKPPKNSCMY